MAATTSSAREIVHASALAVLRRVGTAALVLLTVIFLSYLGLGMAGGRTFQPAFSRAVELTVLYLGRLLQGDLGLSSAGSITLLPVPVIEVVPALIVRSLGLLAVSLSLASLLGVVAGILSALFRNSLWSFLIFIGSIIGISLPSFLLALLLQMGAIQLNQSLGTNLLAVGGFGWDKRLLLPALVLAARPLAQIARVTFIATSEALVQDYTRTADSKGVRGSQVLLTHVLRNTAIPVLTTIGVSLRFSLTSLPVVEYFFGWPGIGFTLLKGIARHDDNLTIALLLSLGAFFIGVNLLLEALYPIIDPRLRGSQQEANQEPDLSLLETVRGSLRQIGNRLKSRFVHPWRPTVRRPLTDPFRQVLDARSDLKNFPEDDLRGGERRSWLTGTLGNFPFLAGSLLLLALAAVLWFAPQITRHNPYTTQGMVFKDGQFSIPPFPPGEIHPWGTDVLGRDLQSLILAGAQQTLLLAGLVMAARLGVGFVLGAIAGWFKNSWIDRALRTAGEVTASFPTLLLAMTLILALGIRSGMMPFIIALCLVGWGEIMQFVRAEIIKIRPRLFVESALALGANPFRIILKHILPNLVPTLAAIAALEMGAILMLLGELGFIGIFIGGGSFAELDFAGPAYHYSDVPEWGALLSNIRTYARSYPWTALYPSLAFFIAIIGFNLFGEGLRRLMDAVGVHISRVVNRYSLAAVLVLVGGFVWLRGSTGALPYYQKQAQAFDSSNVMQTISDLAAPEMDGRAIGSPGYQYSADYIAARFEELGLQPAGEQMTYFQTRQRDFSTLASEPRLIIEDGKAAPAFSRDYVEYARYLSQGLGRGEVLVFAIGEVSATGSWGQYFQALRNLDYSDKILLVLDEEDLRIAQMLPRKGILFVSREAKNFGALQTISTRLLPWGVWGSYQRELNVTPILEITEETANRILAPRSVGVKELRRLADRLGKDELFEVEVPLTVELEMLCQSSEGVPARHVIGHLPGVSGTGASKLDHELVVVLAQYDGPPNRPGGVDYPAANDNASGVAVMLELIRVMKESGYQPNRTFLFVAFSGEGLEGGERVYPRISKLLQTKVGFSNSFTIEAVIDLRGLGSAGPEGLMIYTGGSQRLTSLFEQAARQSRVPAHRAWETVDLSVVFEDQRSRGQESPYLRLAWDGWEQTSHRATDTLESLSPHSLEKAGRVIALAVMLLGRERIY
jgi:ABC-type dipeptide/oligopeptide/nickel transport system permease subunit